ncbi:MAG: ASKHA domain-containing protein [Bilophila wadsworthia]
MELAGADVEEILKVKAAFSLALESLLAASGLESRALARVCLGGALGEHMPETALERLGFLPQGLQAHCGGGQHLLRGAALLLTRPELRERLVRWSSGCTLVDLAARPDFTALYMRHMVFG